MNNEIMKIIMEYGEPGKKLDSSFFSRILEVYFRENGIEGFIDSKVIMDSKTECPFLAALDPKHRNVRIFLKSIPQHKKFIKDEYGECFTLEELGLLFRFSLAQMIIHEAEHGVQVHALVNNDYSTLEKRLLHAINYNFERTLDNMIMSAYPNVPSKEKICAVIDKEKATFERLTSINRDLDLKERLAQIKSFECISSIVKNFDINPNFFKFFNSQISRNQIRGYRLKGIYAAGPTLEFIDILNNNGLIDTSISGYWYEDKIMSLGRALQDLPFEERINLGLPITVPEFNQKTEEAKLILNKR